MLLVVAWLGLAVGAVALLLTGSSVIKTLLIPRNIPSGMLTSFVARSVWVAYRWVTVHVDDLGRRERIHAAGAPTFLFCLLATWVVMLFAAYALVLWPLTGASLPTAVKVSGSSLFTLGFDAPRGAAPLAIVFAEAASGLGVIALLIAYLPVLYSAFNRREILVTMLGALAGNPAWGPEVLARHQLIGNSAALARLYERWAEWAADISESHTAYRSLIYFRSPDPERSWLLSLLSVLDAAALQLALSPSAAPPEARQVLRVGYLAVREMAGTLGLPVNADPRPSDPIALTREEFDQAVGHLRDAGWVPERDAEQAWPHFRGWRVNYEGAAYALARFLDLPPAMWSGERDREVAARPPLRPPNRVPGVTG
jgi:hypothetical protein